MYSAPEKNHCCCCKENGLKKNENKINPICIIVIWYKKRKTLGENINIYNKQKAQKTSMESNLIFCYVVRNEILGRKPQFVIRMCNYFGISLDVFFFTVIPSIRIDKIKKGSTLIILPHWLWFWCWMNGNFDPSKFILHTNFPQQHLQSFL